MDLKYVPDASKHCTRDGMRPSEIARQRPALATRIVGKESYQDFDAQHTIRGGHYTEDRREWPQDHYDEPPKRFVVDQQDRCERMNRQLRVDGDAE